MPAPSYRDRAPSPLARCLPVTVLTFCFHASAVSAIRACLANPHFLCVLVYPE